MTSAKLEGVRCVATGMGGVLRPAAVEMGAIVAAETSVAQTPGSADSKARLPQRLRGFTRHARLSLRLSLENRGYEVRYF